MKFKHTIVTVCLTFLFAFTFCGCEEDAKSSQAPAETAKTNATGIDTPGKGAEFPKKESNVTDSLVNVLQSNVSDVQNKIPEIDKKLAELDNKDSELKVAIEDGDSIFATSNAILLCLNIIAIILSIIALTKISNQSNSINSINRKLKEMKANMVSMNGRITSPSDRFSQVNPNSTFNNELRRLSEKITKLEMELNKKNAPQQFKTPTVTSHEVYFGNPIKAGGDKCYFEIVNNSEKARFTAQIEKNEAHFKPLANLSALKGSDILDRAIEFDGTSSLNSASQMHVEKAGIAIKVGAEWQVIQKAVVRLTK